MIRHLLPMFFACCAILISPPHAADSQTHGATEAAVGRSDVKQLVRDLDSARYHQRTVATEELIQLGVEAIEPLESAFAGGSRELRARAIYIMQEIALRPDADAEKVAVAALQRLAAKTGPTSVEAQSVLAKLAVIREQRSLDRLIALGASLGPLQEPVFVQNRALIIDSASWRGTDDNLKLLANLRNIRALQVSGPVVTDGWFGPIAKMPNLIHLVIKRAKHITNDSLLPLKQIHALQRLDVFYSPIDDGGIVALAAMKNRLQSLKLYGTGVSFEGAQRLAASLPPTAVLDYKRGAFLGVKCLQEGLCQVSDVTEGSAAHRAGIHTGDLLIEFGGKPIRSFDDLRVAISTNAPGDKARLKLLRNATEVSFYLPRSRKTAEEIGIEVEPHPLGLRVTTLRKDGLAAQAGFEKGDILYSVGGVFPKSIDHLIQTLKQIDDRAMQAGPLEPRGGFGRPGNPPPAIAALRGYREVTVEVVFGEWQ